MVWIEEEEKDPLGAFALLATVAVEIQGVYS
jgi:hypothetical protein